MKFGNIKPFGLPIGKSKLGIKIINEVNDYIDNIILVIDGKRKTRCFR